MKKLAVIASGWHYSSHFYEKISQQIKVEGWDIDLFVISHRHPENINTIKEKEKVRNYEGNDLCLYLDKVMYETPITEKEIIDLGWEYIEKPNTIGDMNCFNQWTDDYDYKKYDIFLITHDDNFILSDNIFNDVLKNDIDLYKPIKESRYGISNHQFKTEIVKINMIGIFLIMAILNMYQKLLVLEDHLAFIKKKLLIYFQIINFILAI